jgi:hypothetical protein
VDEGLAVFSHGCEEIHFFDISLANYPVLENSVARRVRYGLRPPPFLQNSNFFLKTLRYEKFDSIFIGIGCI